MNVFFIANWFPNPNNPFEGTFLKNAAEAIAQYDEVTLFFAEENSRNTNLVEKETRKENGVNVRVIYYKPFHSPLKVLNMLVSSCKRIFYLHQLIQQEFKKNRPDIFHFNIVSPSIVLMWYYKLFYGIPFVYSEHWDVPLRAYKGLQKKWLPWRIGMTACSLFASRVLVVSKAIRESFLYYKLSSNVDIIPCVVTANNKNVNDDLRADTKVLLHVSTLADAQKNISGMLKAIAEITAGRSDFVLHILGKGKEFQHHYDYANQLGILNKTVCFHGFVTDEEKWKWFEKSLCHVLFSNFEGYSVVTAESIYFGRPVIVTKCGGPEDFVNEDCGIIIEPKNGEELKKAIHFVLDNHAKFIPARLRQYGEGIFSPARVGSLHHQLYQQILENKN